MNILFGILCQVENSSRGRCLQIILSLAERRNDREDWEEELHRRVILDSLCNFRHVKLRIIDLIVMT